MPHPDMLEFFHLALIVYTFITYEFFFTYQLTHYLNGYIESSHELAKEVKKSGLEVEMLKRAKKKTEKEVGEISMKANITERRAEDVEVALRKVVEGNSHLLSKVVEFETQTKRNAVASEENSCLQKEIKQLKVQLGVEEKRTVKAIVKAVEDFRALEKYEEERAEYSTNAYDVGMQSI